MTCIVGLVHDGITYLGGDAAGADTASGNIGSRSEPKVFLIGGWYAIGITSSFRMGDLLGLIVPAPEPKPDGLSLREHLIKSWIVVVRKVFKEEGYLSVEKSQESGGSFLIGYRGELCVIHGDFQVGTTLTQYNAVGSGTGYALGSLFTTAKMVNITPIRRVTLALEAAAEHNAFVRPPFTIISS